MLHTYIKMKIHFLLNAISLFRIQLSYSPYLVDTPVLTKQYAHWVSRPHPHPHRSGELHLVKCSRHFHLAYNVCDDEPTCKLLLRGFQTCIFRRGMFNAVLSSPVCVKWLCLRSTILYRWTCWYWISESITAVENRSCYIRRTVDRNIIMGHKETL